MVCKSLFRSSSGILGNSTALPASKTRPLLPSWTARPGCWAPTPLPARNAATLSSITILAETETALHARPYSGRFGSTTAAQRLSTLRIFMWYSQSHSNSIISFTPISKPFTLSCTALSLKRYCSYLPTGSSSELPQASSRSYTLGGRN